MVPEPKRSKRLNRYILPAACAILAVALSDVGVPPVISKAVVDQVRQAFSVRHSGS